MQRKNLIRLAIAAITGIIVAILMIASFHIVPQGHIGVERQLGQTQPKGLPEGIHILTPWSSVYDWDNFLRKSEVRGAVGGTKDSQSVHTDISANWNFDPAYVAQIRASYGTENAVEEKFVVPALHSTFRSVTGEYVADDLIQRREAIAPEVVVKLQEKLRKYHIVISDVNLINFGFSKQYEEAIERKVVAKQTRDKAAIDLERAEIDTKRSVVEAEGRAKAIAIEAQSINNQGGEAYIRMKAIEKWNGELPTTMPGNAVPFINVK